MQFKIVYIIFLIGTVSASAQKSLDILLSMNNNESIPYISVAELRMKQLNDTVLILDTRERKEYEVSHISSSKYVGYDSFSTEAISNEIADPSMPIVVYCSLGIRSEDIGEKLKKAGYTNVKNLYGGIFEWKNNDYPVIDSEGIETDEVHAFSRLWSRWLKKGTKVYD